MFIRFFETKTIQFLVKLCVFNLLRMNTTLRENETRRHDVILLCFLNDSQVTYACYCCIMLTNLGGQLSSVALCRVLFKGLT